METLLGLPIDASAHGPQLDHFTALVHWLMLLLFIGWGGYFAYALIRFRAGRNPRASYDGVKSHFSKYVEIAVAIVEAVLLVGFAFPAWARWVQLPAKETNALEIRVVAEQFAWNVQYPGPDGIFGRTDPLKIDKESNPVGLDKTDPHAADDITTINQLHVPINRPIIAHISSKDVIHSFNLPYMRVKQDAIPGIEIPIHFTAVRTTPESAHFPACAATKDCWEIACAQLCGLGHYRMRGFFSVDTPEDFAKWLVEQKGESAPAPAPAAPTPGAAGN